MVASLSVLSVVVPPSVFSSEVKVSVDAWSEAILSLSLLSFLFRDTEVEVAVSVDVAVAEEIVVDATLSEVLVVVPVVLLLELRR